MAQKIITEKTEKYSTANLINALTDTLPNDMRDSLPLVEDEKSLYEFGKSILNAPLTYNRWIYTLLNRIGLTYITNRLYQNPMNMFIKGVLEYGEVIQNIVFGLQDPHQYSPEFAQLNVDFYEKPQVMVEYFVLNHMKYYKTTTNEREMELAFVSFSNFESFLNKQIEQLYTSAYNDEFLMMKYLLALDILSGKMNVEQITSDITDQVESILGASNDLIFLSEENNPGGAPSYSDKSKQWLIINSRYAARMNVRVNATAFNRDDVQFLGHQVMVDGFGKINDDRLKKLFTDEKGNLMLGYRQLTKEEKEALNNIPAVLVDEDYFQIYYKKLMVKSRENEEGLYTNHWLHKWTVYATSIYAPRVIFVEGDPQVVSITITPKNASASPNQTVQFTADVTTNDFASKAVTWSSSSEKSPIDNNGLLRIGGGETGTITVTATSVADSSVTDTATITIN